MVIFYVAALPSADRLRGKTVFCLPCLSRRTRRRHRFLPLSVAGAMNRAPTRRGVCVRAML